MNNNKCGLNHRTGFPTQTHFNCRNPGKLAPRPGYLRLSFLFLTSTAQGADSFDFKVLAQPARAGIGRTQHCCMHSGDRAESPPVILAFRT
jgi:hypothetical protein